jgi:Amt family ammonium transporter
MNTINTLFVLVSTVLVFLMIPGLALFYGGLVRSRNVLSVATQIMGIMLVGGIVWSLVGYSLAFSGDGAFLGDAGAMMLKGFSNLSEPATGTGVPQAIFFLFQTMFAVLTAGLIVGAYAERMRFRAHLFLTTAWLVAVYAPIAHWVWGGGFLSKLGALDFAGGLVVHISSGMSALVVALILGKRRDYGSTAIRPGNLPAVLVGLAMLWVGWFGFNGGSALALDSVALLALVNTLFGSIAGGATWLSIELLRGRPTFLGSATGVLAGLVAITPACGFVEPWAAFVIGLAGGLASYGAIVWLKNRLGYDDALDAFGCHGVAGVVGSLATGVFATKAVNEAGANGLLKGTFDLMGAQLVSTGAVIAFSIVMTVVLTLVTRALVGIRVDTEAEDVGLDISEHGERAYAFD